MAISCLPLGERQINKINRHFFVAQNMFKPIRLPNSNLPVTLILTPLSQPVDLALTIPLAL